MKLTKLTIIALISFVFLTTLILILPITNLKQVIFKDTPEPEKTNYLNNSYFKVIDYNPLSPRAILINNPNNDELTKTNHIVYLIIFKRTSITDFAIALDYEIQTKNKTFQELTEIFQDDQPFRVNPDTNNLLIPCIEGYCKQAPRLSDEEYRKKQDSVFINSTYFGVKNKSGKPRKVDQFRKFKKGTIMQDIRKIVGPADVAGIDDLNYTKSYEALYDIDDTPGINMVILSLEALASAPEEYNDEKLIKVYYANDKNQVFPLEMEE
ncbi:MAG: hypothetical protein ACRCXZ_06185 [Patescibacteria group bacterium]